MADRPSGYFGLPDPARTFLREVPAAWDNTRLVDGYPGRDIIIARQKGASWYIGGLNGEQTEKTITLALRDLDVQYAVVEKSGFVHVKELRRGGFVASVKPLP